MKFEQIDDNIIKVTISLNDLKERDIDFQSLAYNSTVAQELLWDMIELAEIEYGFDFSNAHIVFDPVGDFKETFTITITQLDEENFEPLQDYFKKRLKKNDLRKKRKAIKAVHPVELVYYFDSFDDICLLTRELSKFYSGESSLFKLNDGYYLVLKSNKVMNYSKLDSLVSEYGHKLNNLEFYQGYLNEYGEILIDKKAIKLLHEHFMKG